MEVGASEETSGETVLNESLKGSGFSVAFDPLVRRPLRLRARSCAGSKRNSGCPHRSFTDRQ